MSQQAGQREFIIPIVIVGIIVLVLGAGVAVYLSRQSTPASDRETMMTDKDAADTIDSDQGPQVETEIGSFTGTVTDLLQRGQNLSCTFNRADESGRIAGIVYVASQGEHMRGDFTLDQPSGAQMNAHVLRDGSYNYFWSDQLEQGTKLAVSAEDTTKASPSSDSQQVLDENFEYTCQPWLVDQEMFRLPADKEFIDLGQQVQQIQTTTEHVQQSQCAACDQLEGTAQTQCRAALGC
jgi:hypothetical protein